MRLDTLKVNINISVTKFSRIWNTDQKYVLNGGLASTVLERQSIQPYCSNS